MKESRIFIQPRSGSSFRNIVQEAHDVLRKVGIISRLGGIVNGQGVVPLEVPQALETLLRAGLRAGVDLV